MHQNNNNIYKRLHMSLYIKYYVLCLTHKQEYRCIVNLQHLCALIYQNMCLTQQMYRNIVHEYIINYNMYIYIYTCIYIYIYALIYVKRLNVP